MENKLYEINENLNQLSDEALIEITKGEWNIKIMAYDILEQRRIDAEEEKS